MVCKALLAGRDGVEGDLNNDGDCQRARTLVYLVDGVYPFAG